MRFIEDRRGLCRIGEGSYDALANLLSSHPDDGRLLLTESIQPNCGARS